MHLPQLSVDDDVVGVVSVGVDAAVVVVAVVVIPVLVSEIVVSAQCVDVVSVGEMVLEVVGFFSDTKITPGASCLPPLPEGFSCLIS